MRQLSEYISRAKHLSPGTVLLVALQIGSRKLRNKLAKILYSLRSSYGSYRFEWLEPIFKNPDPKYINNSWPIWEKALDRTLKHRFDLLGSGWVKVAHQESYSKVAGRSYSPKRKLSRKEILRAKEINAINRKKSRKILKLISEDYEFIDWHVDFKSGYRWNPATWGADIQYGHKKGVDIKVPWELSRMQHLSWLAYGYLSTGEDKYALEMKNQVLDFIANNPPLFGVNWHSPMDAAIRAANWIVAFDLFRSQGYEFDKDFQKILGHSLIDHALFIENNFDKRADFRGNHYLSDLAGLNLVAQSLKSRPRSKRWKNICYQGVLEEIKHQFFSDGTNFEGSTLYHRLSTEVFYYYILPIVVREKSWKILKTNPDILEKMMGANLFAQRTIKPDGSAVQIGDGDNGRFFKLNPSWFDASLFENHLNFQHLDFFIRGFLKGEEKDLESSVIKNTLGDLFNPDHFDLKSIEKNLIFSSKQGIQKKEEPLKSLSPRQEQIYSYKIPDGCLSGLSSHYFSDFGLAVFRGESFFLSFRCGPIGQYGRGGHDHNDQLSVELWINGEYLIQDPGTFLYTPWPEKRKQYRSNHFHFLPQPEGEEMADIDSALFFLGGAKPSEMLSFNTRSCIGYFDGFGFPITREIVINEHEVVIKDQADSEKPLWNLKNFQPLTYSRGYGYPRF